MQDIYIYIYSAFVRYRKKYDKGIILVYISYVQTS
jgi:hypothetical protein